MSGCIVLVGLSQGSDIKIIYPICSSDIKRRSMSPNFGLYHDVGAQEAELI